MLSPQSFERANSLVAVLVDSSSNASSGGGPHPSIPHLVLLVFEAVLEVVCVSLPGYIIARMGMFDAESQKFVANLNVMLFTPCLIFTKLASQLTAGKLADLAIIPVLFCIQTLISYISAVIVSRCFGFKRRQSNFVKAMGVSITPFRTSENVWLTNIGVRKLEFAAHFAGYIALPDSVRPALGQDSQRQR